MSKRSLLYISLFVIAMVVLFVVERSFFIWINGLGATSYTFNDVEFGCGTI
jgi:hypothetical protein